MLTAPEAGDHPIMATGGACTMVDFGDGGEVMISGSGPYAMRPVDVR